MLVKQDYLMEKLHGAQIVGGRTMMVFNLQGEQIETVSNFGGGRLALSEFRISFSMEISIHQVFLKRVNYFSSSYSIFTTFQMGEIILHFKL